MVKNILVKFFMNCVKTRVLKQRQARQSSSVEILHWHSESKKVFTQKKTLWSRIISKAASKSLENN